MSLRPFLFLLSLLPFLLGVGCEKDNETTPVETETSDVLEETGNASCELEGSDGDPGLTLAHGETWCGGSTVSEDFEVSTWILTCDDGTLVEENCDTYGASECFNKGPGSAECAEPMAACYIRCLQQNGSAVSTSGGCGVHTGDVTVDFRKPLEDESECAADAVEYCAEYGGNGVDNETPVQVFYYLSENPDETNCEMDTGEMDESLWVEAETSSER